MEKQEAIIRPTIAEFKLGYNYIICSNIKLLEKYGIIKIIIPESLRSKITVETATKHFTEKIPITLQNFTVIFFIIW